MYICDMYRPQIKILLDPGIYVLGTSSSEGKSWLAALLKKYSAYGERVIAYTYQDYLLGVPLSSLLTSSNYDVVLLDRYDKYFEHALEEVLTITDKIVLIDTKRRSFLRHNKVGIAAIHLGESEVVVR